MVLADPPPPPPMATTVRDVTQAGTVKVAAPGVEKVDVVAAPATDEVPVVRPTTDATVTSAMGMILGRRIG